MLKAELMKFRRPTKNARLESRKNRVLGTALVSGGDIETDLSTGESYEVLQEKVIVSQLMWDAMQHRNMGDGWISPPSCVDIYVDDSEEGFTIRALLPDSYEPKALRFVADSRNMGRPPDDIKQLTP